MYVHTYIYMCIKILIHAHTFSKVSSLHNLTYIHTTLSVELIFEEFHQ